MKINCAKVNRSISRIMAAGSFDAEKRRKMYQDRQEKKQTKLKTLIEQVSATQEAQDQIQLIFDAYVPRSGTAKNMGGEYARAMMKILYRWYNDGDRFFEGYGIETCGNAAQLLFNDIPGADELMYDIAETQRDEDEWYEHKLTELAALVVGYLVKNPGVFSKPAVDMYSVKVTDIAEMQPEYEYEVDTSGDLEIYIDNGCIDWDDVEYFLEELCRNYGGEVHWWARDAFTIQGLNKDEYDEWDYMFFNELNGYLNELEQEFPNYGEEDEEYDDDDYEADEE